MTIEHTVVFETVGKASQLIQQKIGTGDGGPAGMANSQILTSLEVED